MSESCIFNDPQPRDLRINHFQRAAIRTFGFGERHNFTRIHDADQFKSNTTTRPLELNHGSTLANQKLTFSDPISAVQKRTYTPETMDSAPSPKMQPSQVSAWIKERQSLRGVLDESTESTTKQFLLGKECNPLERRYLAIGDQEHRSSSIGRDPYSRILMFYQYLMFNFGRKRVDLIKKFLSTHNQALSTRLRILDTQNKGFIPTEEMRNICLQFAKSNTKDTINEMLDFVEDNGNIFYKNFLASPSSMSDMMLYGNNSVSPVDKIEESTPIITSDQVIRQKREEFEKLVQVCKKNNIVLSQSSLERAILLPETRTMDDIMTHFSGISLEPPSSRPGFLYRDWNSSDSEEDVEEPRSIRTYLPKRKLDAKRKHISTGYVRNKPKVDCWLTFEDYIKLMRFKKGPYGHLPLINCKRYLVDSNAFWPGSSLDNQYSYLPNRPKSLNPNRVHFQQVDRRYHRADIPNKHGINIWPTNEAGYVQHGSLADKQCAL